MGSLLKIRKMTYHFNTRCHHMVKCHIRAVITSSPCIETTINCLIFQCFIEIIGFSLTIKNCENQEFLKIMKNGTSEFHRCGMDLKLLTIRLVTSDTHTVVNPHYWAAEGWWQLGTSCKNYAFCILKITTKLL